VSRSFKVYPAVEFIPTFAQVLELGNQHLMDFLLTHDIRIPATLDVELYERRGEENHALPVDKTSPAWWSREQFAWFHLLGSSGGIVVSARVMDDLDRDVVSAIPSEKNDALVVDGVSAALLIGRYWSFRSGGGSHLAAILYGFMAAAMAELTKGFLDSSDAGPNYQLPAHPEEFLKRYLRPEFETDVHGRELLRQKIRDLHRISEKIAHPRIIE
jgi:hypothetical protein